MIEKRNDGRWMASGHLELFSETGTEGGYWAVMSDDSYYHHGPDSLVDGKCPWDGSDCPATKEWENPRHSKYEGLYTLKNGDGLVILDEYYSLPSLLRVDTLEFSEFTVFQESSRGMWVHNHPTKPEISLELWGYLFLKEFPAIIITDKFPFMNQEGWEASQIKDENEAQKEEFTAQDPGTAPGAQS